ncbi:uncharacterized protein LOC129591750 [Paramacrobiotus metropolitanus]|uniref:uncharacterized protein LOC129591750 n=1 Tax=Paramacrobiotus metropolitanus TaxID=2943436 RepID=UPI00244568DC|nr:uncharacterized protein LOC129591750 [Paramacrobiotus metropolitanus]
MMDTERIRAEYLRNGVVLLRDFLSPDWLDKVTTAINKLHPEADPDRDQSTTEGEEEGAKADRSLSGSASGRDFGNWQSIPEIKELVSQSPLLKVLADIMASHSLTFYFDQVSVRPAHDRTLTPFHVEMSNYPFVGDQGCSVVIPVDKIPLETCIKFVQGSHLWGKNYYPSSVRLAEDTEELRAHSKDCEPVPDIRSIKTAMVLEWTMSPGDVLVYNMKTLVALNGNCTQHVQRSLITHWFGDDVRFKQRHWPIHPPLTGRLAADEHPSADGDTFPLVYGQLPAPRPASQE